MWSTFEKGPICYIPNPERPWETELGLNPFYHDMGLPKTLSFDEHIQGHYENMICGSICDQINAGYLKPGKGTRRIPEPDKATCDTAYISNLRYRQRDARVYFQAIVIARLTLYAQLGDLGVKDRREEWFLIDGMWDTDDENHNMVLGKARVYRRGDEPEGRVLTEYLIPQFNGQQVGDEAERILRLYIPEALEKPMRVSAKLLAERMGLRVLYLSLASHDESLGLLFFRKDSVEVIDNDTGEITCVDVEAGTIIINGRLVRREDRKKIVMTAIHECIHQIEHKLFYRLQRLYNDDIAFLSCPNYVDDTDDDPNDPVRWIEWQAREITRCVQMPATTVQMKITELLNTYGPRRSFAGRMRVYERLIRDLASFYGVSRYQAKKRLVALGYEEAVGVLNYVNGAYVPAFSFASGKIGRNQTYTVEFADAFAEYERNDKFREILKDGHFVYVEGHFCLNHPKYVERHGGKLRMTPYGREHVDACCLVFDVKYHRRALKYEDGVLRSEVVAGGSSYSFAGQGAKDLAELGKIMSENCENARQFLLTAPATFCDTLVAHMKRLGITNEELAERTHMSVRQLSRIRNDPDLEITREQIVALCIGLHLGPDLSDDLIDKSNVKFRARPDDMLYREMLRYMYMSSVDECNALLASINKVPLTA